MDRNPNQPVAQLSDCRFTDARSRYLLDESAEPNENILKEAFFRKFNKLDPNDQKKIEQMIDVWRKKS